MSKEKAIKMAKKNDVKFDFKIKGQKPVVTKEVTYFQIFGADFKEKTLAEVLGKAGVANLEE